MAEEEEIPQAPAKPARRRRAVIQRWILGIVAGLLLAVAGALIWLDSPSGHRFVAARVAALAPQSGLRIRIGRIEGSLYSKAVLHDVQLSDPQGRFLSMQRVDLHWWPFAWAYNRLDVDLLRIPEARLHRLPKLRPSTEQGPLLPDFDIKIMELEVGRLIIERAVTGREQIARLRGRADIRDGRAVIDLDGRVLNGADALILAIDSRPDEDRFDVSVTVNAPKGGVLATMAGLTQDANLSIGGRGSWKQWRGRLLATLNGEPVAGIALQARSGLYRLAGSIDGSKIGGDSLLARLAAPRLEIQGQGTFKDRLLDGTLSLRSAALLLEADGGIDLGRNAYDNLGLKLRVQKPAALLKNSSADDAVLQARLDGPISTARFEYLLTARRLTLGTATLVDLKAQGGGRMGGEGAPTLIPLKASARAITGIGDLAEGILRNLSLSGTLQLQRGIITSNKVAIRSDKIDGQLVLLADLNSGRYDAGLIGSIKGLLIPGLGIVDVRTDVRAVPDARGAFTLKGKAEANMRRLDNAFFRTLGGGLPRLTSGIALGPDGRLTFNSLVLTAPQLKVQANGYRRPDGTFHFEGSGAHTKYGPLKLTLDGQIDRPKVDLFLARPLAAAGLKDVSAQLVPNAAGYAVTARGESMLGPFELNGSLLMPPGGTTELVVDRLRVSETEARGRLAFLPAGVQGKLTVTGGMTGDIGFQPTSAGQRIDLNLDANRASFAGTPPISIGRAKITGSIMVGDRTDIDVTVQARGIRRGSMRIGRIALNAKLSDGSGKVTASLSGQRGRLFDLQVEAQVTPDRIRLALRGTLDRRPIRITQGGSLTREADGWRLSPTTVDYAGGQAQLSGLFGGDRTEGRAKLNRMPLTLLDLVNSDLGLGGLATGTVNFVQPRDGLPTGDAQIRIRGLSRSGLAVKSAPIDIGLNAVLTADRLAARASAALEGKTIGRAQALLSPLPGGGTLMQRLENAPLFAQLRYNGRADTIWRLTNIELIDLTGPLAIGADIRGTLATPSITGSLAAQNIGLSSPVTGMALTGVRTRGRFDGSRLVLSDFAGTSKGGGTVTGEGSFDFGAAEGVGIDLRLQTEGATLLDRDDIGATVTGPVRIVSDGNGGTISGDVDMIRGRFTLGRAAAVAAIPELRIIERNRRDGEEEEQRAQPWNLDLKARARNRLAVTGMGLDSEWRADLQIGGSIDNPAIKGQADLVRGGYEFAGRRFELTEGQIRFDGRVPTNPVLDIEAEADLSDVSATIRITGTSEQPDIQFTSVPALPQDELLSRLLFGSSITSLSAPEALQLAGAVNALRGGKGGLDPINAVRRSVGLDRLRIIPADVATGQGTSISAGKYITRRIYVELITDGQGYSATRLEYQITRWLSLLSSVSTIGRQSMNLRVKKDY